MDVIISVKKKLYIALSSNSLGFLMENIAEKIMKKGLMNTEGKRK